MAVRTEAEQDGRAALTERVVDAPSHARSSRDAGPGQRAQLLRHGCRRKPERRRELGAPVQRYVPGFPAKRWPVTIRQLAGHTSGVRHYLGRDFLALGRQRYTTLEEGLAIFAKDSLLFQPGFRYTYSSYGYNLLGVAIEAAAKARFAAGLQRLVLTPLAMWSTVPDYKDSVIIDRAAGYGYGRDQRVINAPYDDASYKWPSGGYLSTAEDVARLAASHLGEGSSRHRSGTRSSRRNGSPPAPRLGSASVGASDGTVPGVPTTTTAEPSSVDADSFWPTPEKSSS